MKRTATVTWHGQGKSGSGHISTKSGALSNALYTYGSRFHEQQGTNPEELIAAAHAACFTMKLSFLIEKAGYKADSIETSALVTLERETISRSHLSVKAAIPGMTREQFEILVDDARKNCIVSRALHMNITADSQLLTKAAA